MKFRQLGASTLRLSEIGYGASRIGDLGSVLDCKAVLEAVWDCGIRYFDTAPGYGLGLSERRLGDFLRTQERTSYVLSTKVGKILMPVGGRPSNVMPFDIAYDYSYDGVMRSFEFSIARLGLSSIDILLADDLEAPTLGRADYRRHLAKFLESGVKALDELKANGDIAAFGIGVNDVGVCLDVMQRAKLDCIMLTGRYTLIDRTAGTRLLGLCQRTATPLIVAGILNGGTLLEDKAERDVSNPLAPFAKTAQEIARESGVNLASAALQFPLANSSVASAVLGTTDAQRIKGLVAGIKDAIPDHVWSRFNSVALN